MTLTGDKAPVPAVPRNAWAVSVEDPPVLHTVPFPDRTDRTARLALCGTQAVPVRIVDGLVDLCADCREHLRIMHERARKELSHAS
ncbi:hypothetical protein [Actinocrispum wychmicini]|uniref:Uncharacterized protein n=1 Tax=Actinocrispum wychmicini TaxID=1213861 RepID=A0A4R2IUM6_9PSEU|nr:hypothetical protein [Actinocrispum wychmicini]TCO46615.1 hypothetical protein EV192_11810 [Actinocrispum wychmicini]